MTLSEVLPVARRLPAADKLRLIRVLAEDLDRSEDVSPLEPHKVYYLATPYGAFGAGTVLMQSMHELDGGQS
jgi:hypothetical protein